MLGETGHENAVTAAGGELLQEYLRNPVQAQPCTVQIWEDRCRIHFKPTRAGCAFAVENQS